jgi:hypothetical protein
MEKQLIVSVPNVIGEDGLTIACKTGKLFRNDSELEELYKDGFRVHDYSVEEVKEKENSLKETFVKVVLRKDDS